MSRIEQPKAGEIAQCGAHLFLRVGSKAFELSSSTRLAINERQLVPGIGEHDCNPASHAAGAEAGNGLACFHANPTRRNCVKPRRSRWPRPREPSVRPLIKKSSPQTAEPMERKARASGIACPALGRP